MKSKDCHCEHCHSTYTIEWRDVVQVFYAGDDTFDDDDEPEELEPLFCAFCGEELES